jgi:hypothetical protein
MQVRLSLQKNPAVSETRLQKKGPQPTAAPNFFARRAAIAFAAEDSRRYTKGDRAAMFN